MKTYQRITGYICAVVTIVCWLLTTQKIANVRGFDVRWVGYMFASCGLIVVLAADRLDPT